MTDGREIEDSEAIGVATAGSPEDLWKIHQPGCAAVIWRRHALPSFQNWIHHLAPSQLPKTRMVAQAAAVRTAVAQCCDAAGTPPCHERNLLVDDVAALALCFAKLLRAPQLRVRLDVATAFAGQDFQIDGVRSRLICTYRGTGTQYGSSRNGAEPQQVFTTPTAAPIVLRGALWPETPPSGLLHRSPPMEDPGETRLLLVVDPLDAPVGGADHVFH